MPCTWFKTVSVYFLHLQLVRPICCLGTCSFPVDFWISSDELRCKPTLFFRIFLKRNNFLFLGPLPTQTVYYHVLLFSSFGSVPKHQQSRPPSNTSQCNICHYEVFGFARANMRTCVCTRVCTCHGWHSTPAGSVIVCLLGC